MLKMMFQDCGVESRAFRHWDRYRHDRKTVRTILRCPRKWSKLREQAGITIDKNCDGKVITYETLWRQLGYELFLEMKEFANSLPESGA